MSCLTAPLAWCSHDAIRARGAQISAQLENLTQPKLKLGRQYKIWDRPIDIGPRQLEPENHGSAMGFKFQTRIGPTRPEYLVKRKNIYLSNPNSHKHIQRRFSLSYSRLPFLSFQAAIHHHNQYSVAPHLHLHSLLILFGKLIILFACYVFSFNFFPSYPKSGMVFWCCHCWSTTLQ